MKQRAHLLISGHVQGVWYRSNTHDKAKEYDLTGWIKNTKDGHVELVVEGDEHQIKKLIAWCQRGPPLAQVTNIKVKYQKFLGEFHDFQIKYYTNK